MLRLIAFLRINILLAALLLSVGSGLVSGLPPLTEGTLIWAPDQNDFVHDPRRNLLYIASGNSIFRYDLDTQTFRTSLVMDGELGALTLSPDANTLLATDLSDNPYPGRFFQVDLRTDQYKEVRLDTGRHEGGTWGVAIGRDGTAIVGSGLDRGHSGHVPVRRYSTITGEVSTLDRPYQWPQVVGSRDGSTIVYMEQIGSRQFRRYDVDSQTLTHGPRETLGGKDIALNHDGSQLAVARLGVNLLDSDFALQDVLNTTPARVANSVTYNHDGSILYVAWEGISPHLFAYNVATQEEVARFATTDLYWYGLRNMKTSWDGQYLFTDETNGVRIYRVAETGPEFPHENAIVTHSGTEGRHVPLSVRISQNSNEWQFGIIAGNDTFVPRHHLYAPAKNGGVYRLGFRRADSGQPVIPISDPDRVTLFPVDLQPGYRSRTLLVKLDEDQDGQPEIEVVLHVRELADSISLTHLEVGP